MKHALGYHKDIFKIYGDPEVFISTKLFKKCDVDTLRGRNAIS